MESPSPLCTTIQIATSVFVGSGVTAANIREVLSLAVGVIVGTGLKESGKVENPVDPNRVAGLIRAAKG
jgi:predicted TIM-barrel enzyme